MEKHIRGLGWRGKTINKLIDRDIRDIIEIILSIYNETVNSIPASNVENPIK